MTPADPFTDENAADPEPEADGVFVIGGEEDMDDDSRKDVLPTPTTKQEQEQEQEPLEAFQHKVLQLMLDLFPGHCARDVKIERMEDGQRNWIIDITLCKTPSKVPWYSTHQVRELLQPCLTGRPKRTSQPKHFVLQLPYRPTQDMHHQATTLAYLGYKLETLVPKIVEFDATAQNALGQAYMLQQRLPGQRLSQLWPALSQAQRMSAIRAISAVLLDIRKIKSRCRGIISIRNTTYDLKHDFVSTEPIPIPSPQHTCARANASTSLSKAQSTKDFLFDLCARQRAYAVVAKLPACNDVWDKISKMIEELHSLGLMPDSSSYPLHHGGSGPRNLLATVTSESKVQITGVMGWDRALFAPAFVSARAPSFLWNGGFDSEGDEGDVLVKPEDTELWEAKRTFEKVVGEGFLEEAYSPGGIMARRLWHFLLNGFTSGADIFLAEKTVEEFERLQYVA
jgi:hypothetical protein